MPEIIARYQHFDLVLFLVDADGKDRTAAFESLESAHGSEGPPLICAAAVQEVEVWLLAGHTEKLNWRWKDVRADISVKENVFEPFLSEYGDARRYGSGRDMLMKQAILNYAKILQRCPELRELQERVAAVVSTGMAL